MRRLTDVTTALNTQSHLNESEGVKQGSVFGGPNDGVPVRFAMNVYSRYRIEADITAHQDAARFAKGKAY